MVNKETGIRELAYIVKIDDIQPIEGSDNCECAVVGGWHIMVRKNTFKTGDYAVYFEIDSKVPETAEFAFLASKHYKIKTQKYTFGGKGSFISQGLLMALGDFPKLFEYDEKNEIWFYTDENQGAAVLIGDYLTKLLNVKYSVQEDNIRKSNIDKYKKMAERHSKLFKRSRLVQWLYKRNWGKKLLFIFLGKKKDKEGGFPKHFEYVKVTDEERIENIPYILQDKRVLTASEKLDGTSSTYILERKRFGKFEFYVVSRHVRQMTPDQKCYHDDNIYWNMAIKYNIEDKLKQYLKDNPKLKYVCIQGESVGSVQGNPLKLTEDDFYCFNFIRSDIGRIPSLEGKKILESWNMKWVPIIKTDWINPDTMEEMKELADGNSLVNPEVLREGIVYRDEKDNSFSFKNVSNQYLLQK